MKRGQLIIFLSYAPASGKSMRMIKHAKKLIAENKRVNIASSNWNNRPDTFNLACRIWPDFFVSDSSMNKNNVNYDVLSPLVSDFVIFDEASFLDINDQKIYEIILDTLNAGVSVLTSINIQKFDEVSESTKKYTHISIKNTIPISFLEIASKIIYIDTPIEVLFSRYAKMNLTDDNNRYLLPDNIQIYKNIADKIISRYTNVTCDHYNRTDCNNFMETAISLASAGFWVEPLFPYSKKRIKSIPPTKDVDKIKDIWTQYPNANLAMPLSMRYNNIIVFDLDIKNGKNGLNTLAQWESSKELHFPLTSISKTGSGGFHMYYHNNTGRKIRSIQNIMDGIDIRAEDAYIVLPPSLHPCGCFYEWFSDDIYNISESDLAVYDFLEENNGFL